MKLKTRIIVLSAVFAVSSGLLFYLFFANIHNNRLNEQLIAEYKENISGISEENLTEELERAQAYNSLLSGYASQEYFDGMSLAEAYESVLNVYGDMLMGTIEIPSIDLALPVYHYTTDEVLKKGAGHLYGTALPIGGSGTRAVISGHRGLPGSELFTNLDQVQIGDVFYIYVLDQVLAYEVESIETVLPGDIESIEPEAGRDLVTLITCTPYGINTHRLLVTGSRIEYDGEAYEAESKNTAADLFSPDYILLYAAAAELIIYIFILRKLLAR